MDIFEKSQHDDGWSTIQALLPDGWREQTRTQGVLQRKSRKFSSLDASLRTLLICLAGDRSYRVTSAMAEMAGLASVTDVTIMDRLHASAGWFEWMSREILKDIGIKHDFGIPIKLIDATNARETDDRVWRIHFSYSLESMRCCDFHLTDKHVGESFRHFEISPGELLVGDRAYARHRDIGHVIRNGGDVLVRISPSKTPIYDYDGNLRFSLRD
ncbi:hypothetical protein ACQZV8_20600 [Magnetococcales bacterium HHB-1]